MIQEILNRINPEDVDTISFDMLGSSIKLRLKDESSVDFEDVVSFFYSDDDHHPLSGEMKPIVYDASGFEAIFGNDQDEEENFSLPNFSVCLQDRSMLIEARKVKIFGNTYHLAHRPH